MANNQSFNNNPSVFVDLNNLFPILNEKVGLSAEQFQKLVENTNFLYNHLGLADVEVGTITTNYIAPGTLADVRVTHREAIVDEKTIDYFDYEFDIPTAQIEAESTASISEDTQECIATVTPEPILNNDNVIIGYKFNFAFTMPRGLQGIKGVSYRNRGAYNDTMVYVNDDIYIDFISYKGSMYCPNVAETTPGTLPTDTNEWSLMVRRGYGISSIVETSVNGLKHTYTITLEDGTTYTFIVTDGVTPDTSGKADKVTDATSGNLAGLDVRGNLTDSGNKASDFALAEHEHSQYLTEHQDISGKENTTNKITLVTDSNIESEILYPSVKAMTKYVDDLLNEIADRMEGI